MEFQTGIDITPTTKPLGFTYGKETFGPKVENRRLSQIRKSLLNPECDGPDPVYAIAMGVGNKDDLEKLNERNLLFGVVTYAAGKLGHEPVRSQGHVHIPARHNKLSPPEIYEIWSGKAIIYMQEYDQTNPGKCYAVNAGPGDVVVVPPNWVHATISADSNSPLTFGAWCDAGYKFDYTGVRAHKGLAWFPVLDNKGQIQWIPNENYLYSALIKKSPNDYDSLNIEKGLSIYQQFQKNPDRFLYISNPHLKENVWNHFEP